MSEQVGDLGRTQLGFFFSGLRLPCFCLKSNANPGRPQLDPLPMSPVGWAGHSLLVVAELSKTQHTELFKLLLASFG